MLEGTLELKDPDHPQAVLAADATARLLLEVHERRQQQLNDSTKAANNIVGRAAEDDQPALASGW